MPAHNSEIAQCEAILRAFEDKFWCLEALNTFPHAVNWNGAMKNVDKNERLAKFGDSLLLKSLCQAWYETSGDAGDWKYIQDNVLTNENLEGVGRNHGLDKCVITNPGTYGVSRRTMATTVEALLAATWYDGGEGALTAVLIKLGLDYETSILVTLKFSIL